MAAEANKNPSPRRAVYEDLLESQPGVIRQGDGWSSMGPSAGKPMSKTTSMASLRERAMAFLRDESRDSYIYRRESREVLMLDKDGKRVSRNSRDLVTEAQNAVGGQGSIRDRNITNLAAEVEGQRDALKRTSKADLRRPGTPASTAMLSSGGQSQNRHVAGQRGLFGRLKGLVGRKGERGEEL